MSNLTWILESNFEEKSLHFVNKSKSSQAAAVIFKQFYINDQDLCQELHDESFGIKMQNRMR